MTSKLEANCRCCAGKELSGTEGGKEGGREASGEDHKKIVFIIKGEATLTY